MLYIYWGSDARKTSDALNAALGKLRARAPHAHMARMTEEAEALDLESVMSSAGLFHAAQIVILDGVFANAEHKKEVMACLEELARSEHVFFIREEKLTDSDLKKLEPCAKAISRHDLRAAAKKPEGNPFALADALLAKDRKQLWLRLSSALREGSEPEELHGILFWGAKNLALAAFSKDAAEAGMHAFVYGKTRRALGKFTESEVRSLVAELAELPHAARRNGVELEYALELFALSR